ncbi:hypothetical protein [Mangrovicoccus algicola]|uniref:Uncharacterized protein n=1 Tax=Mangrovicoccus algicola TaxID=2771008 RepID=A0A8J7CYU5_9RHOB|nr:hypothetical protein [Mangrovicoccus algicola]MBE3636973.1 hypothetical protein [Mangrovicoccus algicola]
MTADAAQGAVLCGDLVGSVRAGPDAVGAAFALLDDCFATVADWTGTPARLTRFRGDGWQALILPGTLGLRAALLLRARFRVAEDLPATRIVLGYGGIDHPGSRDLSDADGPAFRHAGRLLDALPRRRRLAVAPQDAPAGLPEMAALIDALSARWSAAQAEAVAAALAPAPPTQAEIGAALGLTQQAVQDRLDLAGFRAIEDTLGWAETRPL